MFTWETDFLLPLKGARPIIFAYTEILRKTDKFSNDQELGREVRKFIGALREGKLLELAEETNNKNEKR